MLPIMESIFVVCTRSRKIRRLRTVNPQACARYLIWKELITYAGTSRMHTEVVFSIPEEFLFPILQFYNELPGFPDLTTCSTKVK